MQGRINHRRARKERRSMNRGNAAKGCSAKSTFPLCGLHYDSMVSGKNPSIELENKWGSATFSPDTNSVVYPPGVPIEMIPKPKKAQ
jgi:hypothetical protein